MKIAILNDMPTRQEQRETFGSKQIKKRHQCNRIWLNVVLTSELIDNISFLSIYQSLGSIKERLKPFWHYYIYSDNPATAQGRFSQVYKPVEEESVQYRTDVRSVLPRCNNIVLFKMICSRAIKGIADLVTLKLDQF